MLQINKLPEITKLFNYPLSSPVDHENYQAEESHGLSWLSYGAKSCYLLDFAHVNQKLFDVAFQLGQSCERVRWLQLPCEIKPAFQNVDFFLY